MLLEFELYRVINTSCSITVGSNSHINCKSWSVSKLYCLNARYLLSAILLMKGENKVNLIFLPYLFMT